jgi:hypothetical protein
MNNEILSKINNLQAQIDTLKEQYGTQESNTSQWKPKKGDVVLHWDDDPLFKCIAFYIRTSQGDFILDHSSDGNGCFTAKNIEPYKPNRESTTSESGIEVSFGKGTTKYGTGVQIDLTAHDIGLAILAYLKAHDVHTSGALSFSVNGERIKYGGVYVDPSGCVVASGIGYNGKGHHE